MRLGGGIAVIVQLKPALLLPLEFETVTLKVWFPVGRPL
jgi:hypothetical protein